MWPICCLIGAIVYASLARAEFKSPLSPEESLGHFQIDPGLEIELVACEPQVVDPIAIRFDEDGRLWVVEMRDYPHGPPDGQSPLSRIRLLADVDGDGRYESSKVFADHLLFPTGIQPWQGGLIVTLAGEVIYLKDTDGDDRADLREVWFQGFTQENPQLRANHPRFGPDNRVYIANGLRGGTVVDARGDPNVPQTPLRISGMDFCFDPRGGVGEAVSGNGQFGLTFDDFGHRFVCNNRVPIQQIVLENKYLARNPLLAVPAVLQEVAPSSERSHVYPRTSAWTTSNLHAGQFTAACGVEIYRGEALGGEYRGNAFICEPTGSLVHREVLARDSVSFTSRSPNADRDFLTSDDAWFRPVNLELGPDGALYVIDMYRAVIEHPQYMPSELQKRPDLRLGDDRGRIYRIVRADRRPPRAEPKMSTAATRDLVATLDHKNAWWRETATRLLYEQQDHQAVKPLEALVEKAPDAATRFAALGALDGLAAVTPETLRRALRDADPAVRSRAVALADSRLAGDAELRRQILKAAADTDPAVQFQTALALGGVPGEDSVAALVSIAVGHPADNWIRSAVASAMPEQSAAVLRGVLASPGVMSQAYDSPQLTLVRELATVVGSRRNAGELVGILAVACANLDDHTAPCRETTIVALGQGVERRGGSFSSFLAEHAELSPITAKLAGVYDLAADVAADEERAEDVRLAKIELLKFARTPHARQVLLAIVSTSAGQSLRVRAAAALAGQTADEVGRELTAGFAGQTPTVRRAILDALAADATGSHALLNAIESDQVARAEIDAARRTRLIKHPDATVRTRAAKLLADASPADRKAVLADYRSALELKSNPLVGKDLFRKHCAACHQVGGLGVDVAPDISDSRVKTPEQLLVDILNPNQAIDNNYVSYTIVTHDGNIYSGIIASETAASITLKNQDAKTQAILRADVESICSSGLSLMPEGFEKNLSRQNMADVISFVKNWRYLAERIPGTLSQ